MNAFVGLRYFTTNGEPVPYEIGVIVHDAVPVMTFSLQISIPDDIELPTWFNSYKSAFRSKGLDSGKAVKLLNDLVEPCENIYVTSAQVSRVLLGICHKMNFKRILEPIDIEGIESVIAGRPYTYKEIRTILLQDEKFSNSLKAVYGALNDAHCLARYISSSKA